jgi:hypothetical protein
MTPDAGQYRILLNRWVHREPLRGLSLFHGWLLVYLVWRLEYDGRAHCHMART